MSPETPTTRPSAIERLRNFFNERSLIPDLPNKVGHLYLQDTSNYLYIVDRRKTSDSDRDYMTCSVRRDGNVLFEFALGENGLERISFANVHGSFGDESTTLDGFSIGPLGDLTHLHVSDGPKSFQKWGDWVASWVMNSVTQGKFLPIPFKITAS